MIWRSRWASDVEARTYVRSTTASDPRMNSVAYQRAIRRPNVRDDSGRRSLSTSKDITDAPHGVQQLPLERSIDFFAQPADQHIHNIRLRIEAVVPHVRQDHRLRHDAARISHQVFEQCELARPQV